MSDRTSNIIRYLGASVKVWVLVAAVAAGLVVGGMVHGVFTSSRQDRALADEGPQVWTCSMHPQIQMPKPGLCPICGMSLFLLERQDTETASLRELTMSDNAWRLMEIRTSLVEQRFVEAEIRMVGKIEYDETRLKYITAWVPGRLDRLYVDYTGVPVAEGDHMVYMYSPELLSAQAELLQALQAVRNLADSDVGIVRQMTEATVEAVREKLRLWGLRPEQIAEIERRGEPSDHVTIYAPIGGIVIHKNAQEGMYVDTGTRIYTIADLSHVWVRLDAYESDLQWLRYGQQVELTTEAHPGEYFIGTIAFIDPSVTESTRTVKIRVNAPNPDLRLKPGMFVRAIVRARVAVGGRVMDDSLAGMWICPMHPGVVKEIPGECDICEMPLVRTETLGYLSVNPDLADRPLVIPATAALMTGGMSAGSRAIVYVQIDPSLLTLTGVADWTELLKSVRAFAVAAHGDRRFYNVRCPITGTPIDESNVPVDLTGVFEGENIAFADPSSPQQWEALSARQKRERLMPVGAISGPMDRLWWLLSAELREGLLAVGPDEMPAAQLQHQFVREINGILQGDDLYDESAWRPLPLGGVATGLIAQAPAGLPAADLTRLNRLLLEALFPKALANARTGPTFEGREVVLGPRAGDYYIVRHGLAEGERVVTNGNFKIDAELQIQAKPAMMTPEGGGSGGAHQHGGGPSGARGPAGGMSMQLPPAVIVQLRAVTAAADDVRQAVRAGDIDEIRSAYADLARQVRDVPQDALTGHAELLWKEYAMLLTNDGVEGELVETVQQARNVAELMNEHIASMESKMGVSSERPPGGAAAVSPEFRRQFVVVVASYLLLQQALAEDDLSQARAAAEQALAAIEAVDMALLTGSAHMAWMSASDNMTQIAADLAAADDIQRVREKFALLSEELAAAVALLGAPGDMLYQFWCPMAFDGRGASWLQGDEQTHNPYMGAVMPGCGSVTEVFSAAGDDGDANE